MGPPLFKCPRFLLFPPRTDTRSNHAMMFVETSANSLSELYHQSCWCIISPCWLLIKSNFQMIIFYSEIPTFLGCPLPILSRFGQANTRTFTSASVTSSRSATLFTVTCPRRCCSNQSRNSWQVCRDLSETGVVSGKEVTQLD